MYVYVSNLFNVLLNNNLFINRNMYSVNFLMKVDILSSCNFMFFCRREYNGLYKFLI